MTVVTSRELHLLYKQSELVTTAFSSGLFCRDHHFHPEGREKGLRHSGECTTAHSCSSYDPLSFWTSEPAVESASPTPALPSISDSPRLSYLPTKDEKLSWILSDLPCACSWVFLDSLLTQASSWMLERLKSLPNKKH